MSCKDCEKYDFDVDVFAKIEEKSEIEKHGYTSEIMEVMTSSGYRLKLYRLKRKNQNELRLRQPVLMLQGMLCAIPLSFLSRPKPLVFSLVDFGYDVWLGNTRDEIMCSHRDLDPVHDANKYWNFSYHEMGIEDAPTMVDFVLKTTGRSKLFLVSFSKGTTISLVMLSEKPEYNDKVLAGYYLGPGAFLGHIPYTLRYILRTIDDARGMLESMGIYALTRDILYSFVSFYTVVDDQFKKYDKERIDEFLKWYPYTASIKHVSHLAQNCFSEFDDKGTFNHFDYGPEKNLEHYRSDHPPAYNISNINSPVYFLCGAKDTLSSRKDADLIYSYLPAGNKHLHTIADPQFSHLDYLLHENFEQLVTKPIVEDMKKYYVK